LITIRSATQSDQADIKALVKEVGINPLGLKWQRFLVAEDETGRFIGCGQVKPHRDGSLELASIAVKKEGRKQGVARQIIQSLQKEYGRPLWLTCVSNLVPFYEQFGFIEVDQLKEMPAYFRRAKRFFKLYRVITRGNFKLAVMVWPEK
jgi:N-acetylglutamate synthase-like GNAT family acetyltransferase